MGLLLFVVAVVQFPFVIAGHGYDVGGGPRSESSGDNGEGGIGTPWILAVVCLALFTIGLLVFLDPSGARRRSKSLAPKVVVVGIIAAPLLAWTASAGGDEKSLIVERAVALNGNPELLVSLGDSDLNTLDMTNGKEAVRLECVDQEGKVVLAAEQKWPFVDEEGYDYPHAHQPASRDQLERLVRCRLPDTRDGLEAAVKGVLTP